MVLVVVHLAVDVLFLRFDRTTVLKYLICGYLAAGIGVLELTDKVLACLHADKNRGQL